MDLDAFIAVNSPTWERLERLSRRRPKGKQIDELLDAHQRTAAHLSLLRTSVADPHLSARLSMLLARSRRVILGARPPVWHMVRRFVTDDAPAAAWEARRMIAVAAALLFAPAIAACIGLLLVPDLLDAIVSPQAQTQIVGGDFTAYYTQGTAAGFAAKVWTNNAWIAVQCVVLGATGFWPVMMLVTNGLNLGIVAAVMVRHGELGTLLVHLAPHGLLELTCIVIAAGAGLRVFWAWVRPGPLPRAWALARAARALVAVALTLVPMLLVAGLLEAFVTPAPLPAWARVAIGAAAWAGIVGALVIRGRHLHGMGVTGDLSDEEVGDRVAVAP